jgi:hypothetical protein
MTTATLTTKANTATGRIALRKLVWVAPLAIALSAAANLIVYYIADALFGVAWQPMFTPPGVIGSTVIEVLLAALVFAAVAWFSKRPVWLYRRIAVVALILSLGAPLSALFGMAAPPGIEASAAPLDTVITMILMHITAAAISVWAFTTLPRE